MKAAHTPGPWIRKGEQVWNEYEPMYVAAANFDCIMPSQTLIANAKLIAAAPRMLATLEYVLGRIPAHDGKSISQIKAAIQEATA